VIRLRGDFDMCSASQLAAMVPVVRAMTASAERIVLLSVIRRSRTSTNCVPHDRSDPSFTGAQLFPHGRRYGREGEVNARMGDGMNKPAVFTKYIQRLAARSTLFDVDGPNNA
jgi:hypothetical protein